MSTIAAGTTSGTALVSTGNTAGTLIFQTNGTTTALTLGADQSATFVGAVTAPSFSGTSSTATNLAGGSNGTIPYQSAAGTTQMLAVGTAGQLLQTNGVGAPSWATVSAGFTLGTPVNSTSGTAINFTAIPSGVKQVIVSLVDVTMSAAGVLDVRIGTSAGVLSTGYSGTQARVSTTTAYDGATSGFGIYSTTGMGALKGSVIITLENATTNTWSAVLSIGTANFLCLSAGTCELPGVLDRVQLTANGVATFTAGQVNIAYI